jgi:hypothetical protein
LPGIKAYTAGPAVILGDASYSAYLASALVIEFAGRFLVKIVGNPSLGKEVLFQFMLVLAVFLVEWVSYEYVESPMSERLQERKFLTISRFFQKLAERFRDTCPDCGFRLGDTRECQKCKEYREERNITGDEKLLIIATVVLFLLWVLRMMYHP